MTIISANPPKDCDLCPRLSAFRAENQRTEPLWYNAPVPGFGDPNAQILIVGLAPGLKGANATGRPFTGDYAGNLLYATLEKFGYTAGTYKKHADDGLQLKNILISNAVRCVPPQNKPIGEEIRSCRPFLRAQIKELKRLRVIMALGSIAHDSALAALGLRRSDHKFAHNAIHRTHQSIQLVDSYHCSRYNTNTGRLTQGMFEDIFVSIEAILKEKIHA